MQIHTKRNLYSLLSLSIFLLLINFFRTYINSFIFCFRTIKKEGNTKTQDKMLLKSHLDMIGRNEPIQRKAKFWQSYVRALKGISSVSISYDQSRNQAVISAGWLKSKLIFLFVRLLNIKLLHFTVYLIHYFISMALIQTFTNKCFFLIGPSHRN